MIYLEGFRNKTGLELDLLIIDFNSGITNIIIVKLFNKYSFLVRNTFKHVFIGDFLALYPCMFWFRCRIKFFNRVWLAFHVKVHLNGSFNWPSQSTWLFFAIKRAFRGYFSVTFLIKRQLKSFTASPISDLQRHVHSVSSIVEERRRHRKMSLFCSVFMQETMAPSHIFAITSDSAWLFKSSSTYVKHWSSISYIMYDNAEKMGFLLVPTVAQYCNILR